jgi:hypothetical protein
VRKVWIYAEPVEVRKREVRTEYVLKTDEFHVGSYYYLDHLVKKLKEIIKEELIALGKSEIEVEISLKPPNDFSLLAKKHGEYSIIRYRALTEAETQEVLKAFE